MRSALRSTSPLRASVEDGLGAVKQADRACIDPSVRREFVDSLDADEALRPGHDRENRWDYLLGHEASGEIIGVEPHSAKQDEIATVIRKRAAACEQLRAHLREGVRVAKWLWVASGRVHFAATEKAKLQLDAKGIEFVGTKVLAKHLPRPPAPSGRRRPAP